MSDREDFLNTLAVGRLLEEKFDNVGDFLAQQYTRKLVRILGKAGADAPKIGTAIKEIVEATEEYTNTMSRYEDDDRDENSVSSEE